MDELLEILRVTRTRRQKLILLRQRLYLWRRFRSQDTVTKHKLAKALRVRLAKLSKAESYAFYVDPKERGLLAIRRCFRTHQAAKEKLVKHNKRERLMIHSILTDMYGLFTGPDHFGKE